MKRIQSWRSGRSLALRCTTTRRPPQAARSDSSYWSERRAGGCERSDQSPRTRRRPFRVCTSLLMTCSTPMSSHERLSVSPGGRPTAYQSTRRLIKGDCGWRSATEIGPRLRKDRLTRDNQSCTVSCTGGSMHVKKLVSLVEARASLSRLTREVATGGEAIAITQRSRLAAVLVNAERYEEDMAEWE